MCSPAGLSGLAHMASESHKQPESKLKAQTTVKSAFASCLLLSLWPKQVLKLPIFKG